MRRFVNTGPEGAHVPPGELCSGPTLNTSDWSNQLLLRLQYFTDELMLVLFPPSSPQVRISVQPSRCHSDTIRLEVVSNRPHQAPETQAQPQGARGRSQLVQEVVRQAEEASQQAEEKRGRAPKLSKEEREFRQSKCPNLYSLLEEVRELALLDLAACGAGGGLGAAAQACATSA